MRVWINFPTAWRTMVNKTPSATAIRGEDVRLRTGCRSVLAASRAREKTVPAMSTEGQKQTTHHNRNSERAAKETGDREETERQTDFPHPQSD